MDHLTYTEYPSSDQPTTVDPIELESPIYPGQESFRLTVQLLRWAAPKMVEFATGGGDLQQWTNCLGCDCAFISEAMKGVRALNGLGEIDKRELVDVIIYVTDHGWSKLQPIYEGEQPDTFQPTYESADWIIICRPFEQSLGHGMRWLEISEKQATKLLKRYQRKFKQVASAS